MNVFTPNFYSLKKVGVLFVAMFAMMSFLVAQSNPTNGGSIEANQQICPGETPNPLTSTAPASGGTGTGAIEYLWMYSNTPGATPGGAGYTAIPGTNTLGYSPGPLSITTYFVRCARRAGSGNPAYTAETDPVTITVLGSPTAIINGNPGVGYTGISINFNAGISAGSTYSWNFGNGQLGFGQNATVTYNTAGTYTITLVVNNGNCTTTTTTTIVVNNPLIATVLDPCGNCNDPLNFILGPPSTGYFVHDYILINSNPGETWTLSGPTGLVNSSGAALPTGTVIPETSPGVYYLNVWFNASIGGWSSNVTNGSILLSTGPGATVSCPPCPGSPLPVSIISFDATVVGSDVELKWATSSETDNSHFEIEKSLDGQRFDMLAEVESAGVNTSTVQAYNFMDKEAISGVNYYRLKQVDLNGDFEYFNIVTAKIDSETPVIHVLPNPVKDIARVRLEIAIVDNANLELFNTAGELIKTINVTNIGSIQEVNMADLPAGIYFLRLQDSPSVYHKVIKQ